MSARLVENTSLDYRSLAEQVAAVLLEDITKGNVATGNRQLPAETALGRRHGVSRLTVREAIKILASIGVVAVRPGRGTWVTDRNRWHLEDRRVVQARVAAGERAQVECELADARRMMIRGIAELAAQRRRPADITALHDAAHALRGAAGRGDRVACRRATRDLVQALYTAAPSPLAVHLARSVGEFLPDMTTDLADLQTRLVDAIRDGDPRAAAALAEQCLDVTR